MSRSPVLLRRCRRVTFELHPRPKVARKLLCAAYYAYEAGRAPSPHYRRKEESSSDTEVSPCLSLHMRSSKYHTTRHNVPCFFASWASTENFTSCQLANCMLVYVRTTKSHVDTLLEVYGMTNEYTPTLVFTVPMNLLASSSQTEALHLSSQRGIWCV